MVTDFVCSMHTHTHSHMPQLTEVDSPLPPCGVWAQTQVVQFGNKNSFLQVYLTALKSFIIKKKKRNAGEMAQ